jgi:CCR4-NOT transcription complex subunit 4
MKCTADDYDMLKQPIELTGEHGKQLLRGEAVRINSTSDLLKYRCLITPTGCILRHLSLEEEERYLSLERSLVSALNPMQEYPAFTIAEPDVTNRGGGLDALFATPEKFNIRWIDEAPPAGLTSGPSDPSAILSVPSPPPHPPPAPPNVFSSLEADTTRSNNWAIASGAEPIGTSSPARTSSVAKTMVSSSSSAVGADIEEMMNWSDEELRRMIEVAQRELESSRKELDVVDKKLLTLVKRNKKLLQQAFAVVVESVGSSSERGL